MRKRVNELITKSVLGLGPEEMLKTAIDAMRSKNISCIPVLDAGKPIGILTERGMVKILADSQGKFHNRKLKEVMTAPVITITSDMYVYEALHVFVNNDIRHLIVINKSEEAIGIITLSDIISHIGSDVMVEFHSVDRYMSRDIFAMEKNESLYAALDGMAERAISCVIIADGNIPVGILTERDVIGFASQGKDLKEIKVEDTMSTPVIKVKQSSQVHEVTKIMRTEGIRRVVVVSDEGDIAGLVTQTNIMCGLESDYINILKEVIKEQDSRIEDTNRELQELSQYLITILNNSIDMAIVATDRNFKIVYYNGCAEEILDCSASQVTGMKVNEVHSLKGIKAENFKPIMEQVSDKGAYTFNFEREVEDETRYYHARISAIRSTIGGVLIGYVLMVQDVTERKRAEENIRYMAYHDILTGLPNRVAFNERLELEFSHAARKKQQLAAMVIDLDRFKEVNDNYGHFTGDEYLKAVSVRLSDALRKSDTVARVGGDEFMVVLPDIKRKEDAVFIGKKLMQVFQEPIEIKGTEFDAAISVGIAFYPDHSTNKKRLIEYADSAMYKAKKTGKSNNTSNLQVYEQNECIE